MSYNTDSKPIPSGCRVVTDDEGDRRWCVVTTARPTLFKHRPRWRVKGYLIEASYIHIYDEAWLWPRRFFSIADAQAWAHHWLDARDAVVCAEPEIPVGRTMWDLALEHARREVEDLDPLSRQVTP